MLTVDIVVHIVFCLACLCSNCSFFPLFECDRRHCSPPYGSIQQTPQNHAFDTQEADMVKESKMLQSQQALESASISVAMVSVLRRQQDPAATSKLNSA